MASTKTLLDRLAQRDVRLWAEAGSLRFQAPAGAMSQELLADLRAHRDVLLRLLAGTAPGQPIPAFQLRARPRQALVPWFFKQPIFMDGLPLRMTLSMSNAAHLVLRVAAPLRTDLVAAALATLLERHQALHAGVKFVGSDVFLSFPATRAAHVESVELTQKSPGERECAALRRAAELVWREMELDGGPLFRVFTIAISDYDHIIGFVLNHVIADAVSLGIFTRELLEIYRCKATGSECALPAPRIQYSDYLLSVEEHLRSVSGAACLACWVDRFKTAPPTALPADLQDPLGNLESRAQPVSIDTELTVALQGVANRLGATLFCVLVAVQLAAIYHLTGQEDLTIFLVASMRDHTDLNATLGAVADIEPCRSSLAGNPPFEAVVRCVARSMAEAAQHRPMPFDRVSAELAKDGRSLIAPVFNFIADAADATGAHESRSGVQVLRFECPVPSQSRRCFTYALYLTQRPSGIAGILKYRGSRYSDAAMGRFIARLTATMRSVVLDSGAPVAGLYDGVLLNH